jgi:hypothetical protein
MQQATNQPPELALAIRLDPQRAALWSSNLAAAFGSMPRVQSLPATTNCLAWRLPLTRAALSTVGRAKSNFLCAALGL